MRTIEQIKAEIATATARATALNADRDRRLAVLKMAIADEQKEERYEISDTLRTLTREQYDLEQAAIADHPLEGRRVTKIGRRGRSWRNNDETLVGIVETRRAGTLFPGTISHGLPRMGTAFIRMCKKDGTPGLQFKPIYGVDPLDERNGWYLVEETVDG